MELTGWASDEDLLAWYRRASVYVQASRHEGFGLAVAEAMLAGCVPVVLDVTAMPEVVGDAGVLIASQDPGEVADGVRRALELGPEGGRRARERILTAFPLHRRGEELRRVVARGAAKAPERRGGRRYSRAVVGLRRRDPDRPGALERGRMRRRLRRQTQVREALLLDLGALVFELHRQGRREPELLQAKAAELLAVDEEVRALSDTLGTGGNVLQLTAAGIAGSCSQCAAIMPHGRPLLLELRRPGAGGAGAGRRAAPPLEAADPDADVPPLPPREDEQPSEIPTEERAALEAGDFERG